MRILNHFETLLFYDSIELFSAHDQMDVLYLCVLVDEIVDSAKYLCTPLSKGYYKDFISGNTDLLTIFKTPETGELFTGAVTKGNYTIMPIELISEIPNEWFPEPGFFLKPEPISDIQIINESRERQRAIVHCSLNPPEAKQQSKIAAERLGQAVKVIQRVITYAFRNAIKDLDKETREIINQLENYQLEVFAFSPGLFTLHMQVAAPSDMFGYSQIERALKIVDIVSDNIDNADLAIQFISKHGGHFATAYGNLLQFIIENKTPLSYEWSMPDSLKTTPRTISYLKAEPLYRALIERIDITKKKKSLSVKLLK